MLYQNGPLLIAANHPNSFLDAVIIGSLFKSPVYSLARGDAFSGKIFSKILRSFNMLPIYRVSEGTENLSYNYTTFNECDKLFKKNKIVLIFSEGGCINEWRLRTLKKGTARLALNAWADNIPLKVLPLGINYSSFRFFGKNIYVNFGNIITDEILSSDLAQGKMINVFNDKLKNELQALVFEINKNDHQKLKDRFYIKPSLLKKIALFVPAMIGFMINAPLYFSIHLIIKDKAADHYDSVMTGLLFFFYPLYVLIISLIVFLFSKSLYSFLLLAFLPFTVWSYLQIKKQIPQSKT